MPNYYFHLYNRTGETSDNEGRDFSDLETARTQAIREIRSILSEEVKAGAIDLCGHIDIEDGDGAVLRTVAFADAVTLKTEN